MPHTVAKNMECTILINSRGFWRGFVFVFAFVLLARGRVGGGSGVLKGASILSGSGFSEALTLVSLLGNSVVISKESLTVTQFHEDKSN